MALAGDLSDFSLIDIIQLVDLGKKSGEVVIHGERGSERLEGHVFFREGKIHNARVGTVQGEEAAYMLFTCTAGPFEFQEGVPLPPRNVQVGNEIVIMEGIGRQDAWAAIAERIPSGETVLKLVPNPRSSSREINLEADKWRVLTLINGKHTVAELVQKSGLGQFRAYQIVAELVEAGLIEIRADAPEAAPPRVMYPELERIAVVGLGNSARVLLADAYRRAGLRTDDATLSAAQLQKAIGIFEQATTLLLGPSRARALADQLRTRVGG